ncbi:MAG: hypothetical protein Q9220_000327 [cf. Caloplaca sp. 1 TL-2023]
MTSGDSSDTLDLHHPPDSINPHTQSSRYTNGSSVKISKPVKNREAMEQQTPAAMQHRESRANLRRRGKRKETGLVGSARHHTRKFYRLSYHNPSSGRYGLGWDDSFLVIFWIIAFTGLRAATMDYILAPLAEWLGIAKSKMKTRFAEQAWVLIYDSTFWSLGMYIMYNSDYWLDLRQLWTNWPDREMNGLFKWYYLAQFAFWIQQIVVVNIEERRKDHWQMFTHHIVTCSLMFMSYGYHQTKVGNTILCLMDVVDLLLPLAKMFKYLDMKTPCDVTFVAFALVWFVARHILYGFVCYSVYADIPTEINYGCYRGPNANLVGPTTVSDDYDHLIQPFRDPEGLVCWDNNIKWIFLWILLILQTILLIWFGMILQVLWKAIKGQELEDSRSDVDEDESEERDVDEEEEDYHDQPSQTHSPSSLEKPPLEEEVGVESMRFLSRKPSTGKSFGKFGSTATGVHLPSDSKELLGRIGCDKGT